MVERIDAEDVSRFPSRRVLLGVSTSRRAEGEAADEFLYESVSPSSSFLSGGDPPPKPCILLCPSERHVMCRENNNGT